MPSIELIPLVLLAPILVCAGYCDLRHMRIPNFLGLAAVALFLLTAPLLGWNELLMRVASASILFVLGFAAFALRLFGGGDIKMTAALMLFIPSQTLVLFAAGFSFSMLAGIMFVLVARAVSTPSQSGWVGLASVGKFPMGISIALSGLIHPIAVTVLT